VKPPSPFSTAGPALPVATGACGGQAPGGGPSLSLRRRRRRRSTSSRTGRGRGGSFLLPASSSPPARRHPRRTTRSCSSPLRDGAEHQQPAARWGQHERSAHARARCIWGTRHANGTSRALYSPPVRGEKRYMPTGARSSVGRGVPSATSLNRNRAAGRQKERNRAAAETIRAFPFLPFPFPSESSWPWKVLCRSLVQFVSRGDPGPPFINATAHVWL
jgi:hypothetical protein